MSGGSDPARGHPRLGRLVNLSVAAAFVVAYVVSRSITTAMLTLAVASLAGIALTFLLEGRLARVPLIAAVGAGLTAGLALVFHAPGLVKVEMTVQHLLIGVVLLAGLSLHLNPLKILFNDVYRLPDSTWTRLTLRYALFAFAVAALNEVIRRTQSDPVWVMFRFPGLPILHGLFVLTQLPTIVEGRRQIAADDPGRSPEEPVSMISKTGR